MGGGVVAEIFRDLHKRTTFAGGGGSGRHFFRYPGQDQSDSSATHGHKTYSATHDHCGTACVVFTKCRLKFKLLKKKLDMDISHQMVNNHIG